MWKYVLAWFPMVAIAIVNGVLRESWGGKHLRELAAHQASTLTAHILFGVYIWFILRIWRPASAAEAIRIGLFWLAMTITFEFLFGSPANPSRKGLAMFRMHVVKDLTEE